MGRGAAAARRAARRASRRHLGRRGRAARLGSPGSSARGRARPRGEEGWRLALLSCAPRRLLLPRTTSRLAPRRRSTGFRVPCDGQCAGSWPVVIRSDEVRRSRSAALPGLCPTGDRVGRRPAGREGRRSRSSIIFSLSTPRRARRRVVMRSGAASIAFRGVTSCAGDLASPST